MDGQIPSSVRQILALVSSEALTKAQNYHIPEDVPSFAQPPAPAAYAFVGIVPFLRRMFILIFSGTVLLISSLGLHGLFYFIAMPSHHATEPLFFDYSGISRHPAPVCVDESSETCSITRHLPGENVMPWAVADLFSKHSQWEAFQEDVIPLPRADDRILKIGQAYYLEVALELPESDINRAAGVFGVSVEVQSSNGTMLASSMRAARLPHESAWVATLRKLIWLFPLLIGAVQETRTVVVPSFRHLVESRDFPLKYVTVRLIMKERHPSIETLEVIAGEIRMGEELSYFQLLLKEWFFTCYLVGTCIFFALQVLLWFLFQVCWSKRRQRQFVEDPLCDFDIGSLQGGSLNERWEDIPGPQEEQEEVGNDEWEDLPQPAQHDNSSASEAQPDRQVPPTESSSQPNNFQRASDSTEAADNLHQTHPARRRHAPSSARLSPQESGGSISPIRQPSMGDTPLTRRSQQEIGPTQQQADDTDMALSQLPEVDELASGERAFDASGTWIEGEGHWKYQGHILRGASALSTDPANCSMDVLELPDLITCILSISREDQTQGDENKFPSDFHHALEALDQESSLQPNFDSEFFTPADLDNEFEAQD